MFHAERVCEEKEIILFDICNRNVSPSFAFVYYDHLDFVELLNVNYRLLIMPIEWLRKGYENKHQYLCNKNTNAINDFAL